MTRTVIFFIVAISLGGTVLSQVSTDSFIYKSSLGVVAGFYPLSRPGPSPACANEDFESSVSGAITSNTQISGWTVTRGYHINGIDNCIPWGCCTATPIESSLVVAPIGFVDPVIGSVYPLYSVFGSNPNSNGNAANPQIPIGLSGDNFIRINSSDPNDFSMENLAKSFSVTAANCLFAYAFVAVMSKGHGCCVGAALNFVFRNITTNSILTADCYATSAVTSACSRPGTNYYLVGSGAPATVNSSSIAQFSKWQINYVDLSAYIGDVISVEIIAGDCDSFGHFGYAYIDARCGSLDITVNGLPTNTTCVTNPTVSGPPNLNAYTWTGPNNFTSAAISFTTTTAGVYTLTIPQNPPLSAVQKTLDLVISLATPSLYATSTLVCEGQFVKLTASGLTSYSWSSGETWPSITFIPTHEATYVLTGKTANNCDAYASITISVMDCSGIEVEEVVKSPLIFPNPNNGEFTMFVTGNKCHLTVTNKLGQIIHSQSMHDGDNKVRLSSVAAGIYYYSISEGQSKSSGKFAIE